MLSEQLALIDLLEEAIERISQEIAQRLDPPCSPPADSEHQTACSQEAQAKEPQASQSQPGSQQHDQPLPWKQAGDVLDTIPGMHVRSAEGVLAEMGIEMTRFPTAAHLARLRCSLPRK